MRINETLIQRTFENEFNEVHYKELVLNLFNHFDFSKEHSLKQYFTEDEKQKIKDFTYLGTYEDIEKKPLDVLIVELKSGSRVERARSLQRNLIGKYLKTNLKDSALVAFYSKDNPDWRLSFVKMDYRLDERGVKVEIGTPPKRYSFLVGKTEPSHTAQKQLLPLLDDKKIPNIEEIEKSFSIEKVTKEFYTEIAKKFTELVGGERKVGSKKMVEKGCLRLPSTDDDTVKKEFAVRLIGRLLFCWFLKKKKSEKGEPLLTSVLISSDAVRQEQNYYHRFLEPLFFQVLNTPQESRKDCFKKDFWNKTPFLNGGLFEPHQHDFYMPTEPFGHSRHINTLKIPDEWFLDLFKIFEIYNFTIDESTSIDIDISVDPEMLGRIFENLLAEINPETGETARKSTGSYYTPRPIVEYMVDESLKQYLKTQLKTSLRHSELVSESKEMLNQVQHDKIVSRHSALDAESSLLSLDSRLHGNDDIDDKFSKLLSYSDEEVDITETEKDSIIDALDRVKIIDPACGSGAFPMGILHKMLLILQKIDPESKQWLSKKLARIDNEILRKELGKKLKTENWDYVHKLGIIQSSIYGVDIQPIAVEISKLRFFLSLIVDEKIDDDKPNRGVVPLPNLEFKFVAANSLIGLPQYEKGTTIDFSEADHKIEELKKLREDYFTSIGEEKRKIEKAFLEKQKEMLEQVINWQKIHKTSKDSQALKLSEWNPFEDTASSWFDPEWMFGAKDGFDIVIANPPYIRVQSLSEDEKQYYSKTYQSATGNFDLYVIFAEKGFSLTSNKGLLSFIQPNKFFASNYGVGLRKFICHNNALQKVIDFRANQVFETATTYTCILFLSRQAKQRAHYFGFQQNITFQDVVDFLGYPVKKFVQIESSALSSSPWSFNDERSSTILQKIKQKGIPLESISINISQGFKTGADKIFINFFKNIDNSLLIPVLKGEEIQRYAIAEKGRKAIFPYKNRANKVEPLNEKELETYAEVYEHLKRNKTLLLNRDRGKVDPNKWYLYSRNQFINLVKRPKIITRDISQKPAFAFDEEGKFGLMGGYGIILTEDLRTKYVLAILNSLITYFQIKNTSVLFRGAYFSYESRFIKNLSIPKLTVAEQRPFEILVDQILSAKQKDPNADTSTLEHQIDKMVYELYDLTSEEIEIVEGKR